MNYQTYAYETDTDSVPWTAAPSSTQMVAPHSDAQIYPLTPNPVLTSNVQSAPSAELLSLGSIIQSMQRAQTQQLYLMRDFDARLRNIENGARVHPPAANNSFERMTWWAIWGLLMLILGGALVVIIVLILLNIQFR